LENKYKTWTEINSNQTCDEKCPPGGGKRGVAGWGGVWQGVSDRRRRRGRGDTPGQAAH